MGDCADSTDFGGLLVMQVVSADRVSADAKSLEVQVHIEVNVGISLGLEVFASIFGYIAIALEVFMKNSIAFFTSVMACVWCGIAFLRSLW